MRKMINSIENGKKIFVGLEDSKRTWKLCIRSEGMVIHETSMPAKYSVLKAFFDNQFPKCDIHVLYEAGFKGFTLHDKLAADGYHCTVTPPHLVTQEKANRVKCDKVDARRLAIVLESGDFHACHVPDRELRMDRQYSRSLVQVQKDINRCKNRIRKFLDFHGFDESLPAGNWYDREYEHLKSLELDEPLQFCLNLYLEELADLQDFKHRLQVKLKELGKKNRYSRLFKLFSSAPGVGWFTAIRLVLEWGEDLSRFVTGKKFACFTGLTSAEFSTGESVRRGRITGQSNPAVRTWLVECAWTAYKQDPALLEKFKAIYNRTSSKKKAIVAVARKLAVRLRAIALTGVPYQVGVIQ
jgi:transposase